MKPLVEIKDLTIGFQEGKTISPAVKGISFEVREGEILGVVGESGSGKSTLLNCISCYIPFEEGKITLGQKELKGLSEDALAHIRNEKLGFVFQDFMLLDGLTVRQNILLPAIIRGNVGRKEETMADRLCNLFGIAQIAGKYPAEISGGERQRTAVARALINSPLLILADEPTGNLDSKSSRAVIDSFLEAKASLKATIFMVTHDSFSASFCDRVILLKDGVVYKNMERNSSQHAFHDALLEELKQMNTLEEEEENNENLN